MTAKDYLKQAFRLDVRIDAKLTQLSALRELAMRVRSVYGDQPRSSGSNLHRTEATVEKIWAMEEEINQDVDHLVDLKSEIASTIASVNHPRQRLLLELRYLCFHQWSDIAIEMNCSIDNVYALHQGALRAVKKLRKELQ
jgi:DNA-directed RNA polymerase specialized sigma24 family protein